MISEKMRGAMNVGSGIRQAFNEARRQKEKYGEENVFDLSIGNPMAPVPAGVKNAIDKLSKTPDLFHGYMSESGYESVRQRIADFLNKEYRTSYGTDNVIMTNGVAGGINLVMNALLDPGDEVILFRPFYPAYAGFVKNQGAKTVMVNGLEPDFQPDLEELVESITEKTKIVIVNSPHNPSGTIYEEETAKKICGILKMKQREYGHGICLLSDEPYRDLVYDGTKLPWWPDLYENTIVSYSFSKSLSLAGERIGYLVIPDEFEDFENVLKVVRLSIGRLGYVNAPAFFQRVIGECLEEKVDLEYYDKGRRILYETLTECGFTCVKPRGAFYIFVKSPLKSEAEFLELARKRHLILVGGSVFGYEGYARISFCCGYHVLEKAAEAFKLLAQDCGLI